MPNELHNSYCLANIIKARRRRIRWAGNMAGMGHMKNAYTKLIRKN
jgi:hypothetical protein